MADPEGRHPKRVRRDDAAGGTSAAAPHAPRQLSAPALKRALLSEKHRATLVLRLSSLDQRHLLYLHEASIAGSLSGAADRLGTNASVLSRSIAKMEADLQVQLLERHGRGVRLTEAGAMVEAHFLDVREKVESLVAQLRDLGELRRGTVSIAVGEGFLEELMDEPLRGFARKHPDLGIDFQVGSTDELVRRVLDDAAHIGLLYNLPPDPGVHSHASAKHPMRVATSPRHPLALLGRKLTMRDIQAQEELGLLPGSFGVRQAILTAEYHGRVSLKPRVTANSSRLLVRFAKGWNGVILTPSFAISRELAEGSLVALETEDAFLESVEAHLVTRRGRRLPAAAAQLLRHIKATLKLLS